MAHMQSLNLTEDTKSLNVIPSLLVQYADLTIADQPIGEGGCGKVYYVDHMQRGSMAFKKLSGNLNPDMRTPLLKELDYLKELRHDNIIQLLGYVWESNKYGLLLHYCEHRSLDRFLPKHNGHVTAFNKLQFCTEIATGMNYLHTRRPAIVHRDLKMGNVLVDNGCRMKITDFGISKWRETEMKVTRSTRSKQSAIPGAANRRLDSHTAPATASMAKNTCTGGTYTHLPPERWRNIGCRPNEAYDVYANGILMWEIFTESEPFADARTEEIKLAVIDKALPGRPDIDLFNKNCRFADCEAMRSLMTQCWCDEPGDRPTFEGVRNNLRKLFSKHAADIEKDKAALMRHLHPEQTPETPNRVDSGVGSTMDPWSQAGALASPSQPDRSNFPSPESCTPSMCSSIQCTDAPDDGTLCMATANPLSAFQSLPGETAQPRSANQGSMGQVGDIQENQARNLDGQANVQGASRQGAETQQQRVESQQQGADSQQQGAESQQQGAESQQQGAESQQQGAESQQQGAESKQQGAESPQQGAESKQQGAESPQQGAESQQQGAESQQQGAESQQQGAESQQQGAESQQQGVESQQHRAESQQGDESQQQGANQQGDEQQPMLNVQAETTQQASHQSERAGDDTMTDPVNIRQPVPRHTTTDPLCTDMSNLCLRSPTSQQGSLAQPSSDINTRTTDPGALE